MERSKAGSSRSKAAVAGRKSKDSKDKKEGSNNVLKIVWNKKAGKKDKDLLSSDESEAEAPVPRQKSMRKRKATVFYDSESEDDLTEVVKPSKVKGGKKVKPGTAAKKSIPKPAVVKSKLAQTAESSDTEQDDDFDPKSKPPPAKKPRAKATNAKKKDKKVPAKLSDEKTKARAQNYSKLMARSNAGPRNLGMKEIPEGAADCLKNLTFVVTGMLDSIERGSCKEIVEKYGGRLTTAVSKKTNYLIVGDEPGESKIKKAAQLNVPHLTEDGLFEMLRKSNPDGLFSSETVMNFDSDDDAKTEKLEESDIEELDADGLSMKQKSISQPITDPGLFVDKYKPKSLKNVVGQFSDYSSASKLVRWLRNWTSHHGSLQPKPKGKAKKPSLGDPDGKSFKCALLSGPPGIGKTTTAQLACKELGYDYFELNASDKRNKSCMKSNIVGAISSKVIILDENKEGISRNHVLIMDEVDGISGNEDRGGVQELIALIKTSRIPIICICNDRFNQKIRYLANHCFDLRFYKPNIQKIKGLVSSICFKEQIKLEPQQLTQLLISTDQDIRQILNQLQIVDAVNSDQVFNPKKDVKLGLWDVCRKVFLKPEHKSMSMEEKIQLFFQDYNFGPLFIQENYIKQYPAARNGSKQKEMNLISKSAAAIADGDLVDNLIRRSNNWGLLPLQAIFSSYMPGQYMACDNIGQIDFPKWLGKNSNRNKRHRLLRSMHSHVHLKVSGSLEALNMDYLPYLRRSVVNPIVSGNIQKAADSMEDYNLLREDFDSMNELGLWPRMKNQMDKVETKTKAAFTRLVNKKVYPYSNGHLTKAKERANVGNMEGLDDEDDDEVTDEDEEEKLILKDAMVKMKIRKQASKKGRGSKK